MRLLALLCLSLITSLVFAAPENRSPEQQKIEFLELRVQELHAENKDLRKQMDGMDEAIQKAVNAKTESYDKLNGQSLSSFNSLISLLQTGLIITSAIVAILTWIGWHKLSQWVQELVKQRVESLLTSEYLDKTINEKSGEALTAVELAAQNKFTELIRDYEAKLADRLEQAQRDAETIAQIKQQNLEAPFPVELQSRLEALEQKAAQTPAANRTPNDLLMLGLQAFQQEKYEEAYEHWIRAGSAAALGNAGVAAYRVSLRSQDEAEKAAWANKAEELYRQAIAGNPNNANILFNFALLMEHIHKNPDEAEALYRRAIDADPNNVQVLNNLANLMANERKNPDETEALYRRAIDADPNNATTLNNLALFMANVRKNPDEAEALYRRALDADPNYAAALFSLALLMANVRKKPDEAAILYRRAIDATPNNANTLGNYAQILFALRRDTEAVEKLATALKGENASPALAAELQLYRYAHLADERGAALAELKRLIQSGLRTGNWSFDSDLQRAREDGHPQLALLEMLIKVLGEQEDATKLDEFPEWQRA